MVIAARRTTLHSRFCSLAWLTGATMVMSFRARRLRNMRRRAG